MKGAGILKLTVLVDNNTLIDRYFLGEPGVSYLIEEGEKHILFDAGYSDAFITNASRMNIDLYDIDSVVISHGHMDHTWGLFYLIKRYAEAKIEKIRCKTPDLVAHPLAFLTKTADDEEIGTVITEDTLSRHFNMKFCREPVWLTENLVFLGEIERSNGFENKKPIGKVHQNRVQMDDYLMDDSAMVYKSEGGLVIITGCSHAGICNIIEYAKKICKDNRIADVIGGFHLLDPSEEVMKNTCDYIKANNIEQLHACHCTDLRSKIRLSESCPIKEVGVGMILEYDQ